MALLLFFARVLGLTLALAWSLGPEGVQVTWHGPPGCGDADQVERRVGALQGDDAGGLAPVTAEATVETLADGRYRLRLDTQAEGHVDHREFEAPDCRALVEGAALIVSLAAAPAEPVPEPEPVPVPEPELELELEPEPELELEPEIRLDTRETPPVPESNREHLTFALGADVGVSFGLLGTAWPTVAAHAALRWRALRIEAGAAHWFAREFNILDGPRSGRARTRATAALVRGCGVPQAGRWEFPICAGLTAGALTSAGDSSLPGARTSRQPWLAVSAGAGVAVPVHPRIALSLQGLVDISVVRPGFAVQGIAVELYRMPSLTASARLGIEVRFP